MNNKMKVTHREERNVLDELLYDHEDDDLDGETRPRETPTKPKTTIESIGMDMDAELIFSDSECSCEDHSSVNSEPDIDYQHNRQADDGQEPVTDQNNDGQDAQKKIADVQMDDDQRNEFTKSPSLKIEIRRKSRHTIITHESGDNNGSADHSHSHSHHEPLHHSHSHHHNHHLHHHRARGHGEHHHRDHDNRRENDDDHHRRPERVRHTSDRDREPRLPIVVRRENGRRPRQRSPEELTRNGLKAPRNGHPGKEKTGHENGELLKYFFKDAIYFMVKSNNIENVEISMKDGVWSTPSQNEARWNLAFNQFRNVILVFSVKESGRFAGYARLSSESDYDCEPVNWILPSGVAPFGGVFYIDWICKNELPFTQTGHLYNAFNDGKPVKIARDGQEIEPQTGEDLCRMFPVDNTVDLIPHLKRMKKQTQNRKKNKHNRGPFMSSGGSEPQNPSVERRSQNSTSRQDSYLLSSRGQIPYNGDVSSANGVYTDRRSRGQPSGTFDRSRLTLHGGNGSAGLNTNGRSRAYHPYSRTMSTSSASGQYMEPARDRHGNLIITSRGNYARQNSSASMGTYGYSRNYDQERTLRRTVRSDGRKDYY